VREIEAKSPVEALVEASRTTDLVIVGSRGAHGIAALGSVAERVAHQAGCSVLIVRGVAPEVVGRGGLYLSRLGSIRRTN
jgi:nucleotide-binding universal stress UspA family protein